MTDRWHGKTPFLRSAARVAADAKRYIERGRTRQAWPWPLVLALRAADLAPPAVTDPILRAIHFDILPPEGSRVIRLLLGLSVTLAA